MTYWPSHTHIHALRAAMSSPEEALAAYTQWRRDGHAPDVEERRLLALIAAKVAPLVPDDAWLAQIHRERRRTMATHLQRVASCHQLSAALNAEGIDSLWLKGMGMLAWYADPTLRTMFDADLLVPWHQRHEAIDLVADRGFVPVGSYGVDAMHTLTERFPGWGMQAPGVELDVHWRPLHYLALRPHIDAALFARARTAMIGTVEISIPDPSDHLALVAGHGMRAQSEAHLISLVDACQLLRAPSFDADRAAQLASAYERTTALLAVCDVLQRLSLTPELDDQVSALRGRLHRRTIADRLVARLSDSPDAPFGPVERKRALQADVWRAVSTTPLRKGGPLAGLLEAGRIATAVPRARDIVGELLWRASGRSAVLERLRADRTTSFERRPLLSIGDQVQVGTTSWLAGLLPTGWSIPEHSHVWTNSHEATIDIDLELGDASACNISLVMTPFVGPVSPVLTVSARVNRQRHSTWEYELGVHFDSTHRMLITRSMLDHDRCQVTLVIDGASSPFENGISDDSRMLGLCLQSLTIEPIGGEPQHAPTVRATLRRR